MKRSDNYMMGSHCPTLNVHVMFLLTLAVHYSNLTYWTPADDSRTNILIVDSIRISIISWSETLHMQQRWQQDLSTFRMKGPQTSHHWHISPVPHALSSVAYGLIQWDMGECPPLGDKKNFDALKQSAICFLLLVPIYKRVQNNTTRMHENPPFWYQKIFWGWGCASSPDPTHRQSTFAFQADE